MARKGQAQSEIVNSEGTDKYEAGAYKRSDDSLLGPIYAIQPSADTVITALKNAAGEDIFTNYVDNALTLAAGELIFFRELVHEITFTGGPALVFYQTQIVQS